ncbi:tyrosine-type recombinase/integrase [Proteiniclasticum sp. QWL-01]|uniref:tyrosine-type recombinase/integrase n=1 Tax=Proteiniclasticum sp. QWL-01 TaxID=3036945 RepID=UPI00240EBF9A|nr:tyrosine-type recombinase/integrase [Proteiniclasticum sp. QWL-01]WFF73010.1 tyrosine-type recombinase/integrase [Proteiniclasticum sp. QWL-01]
MRITTYEQEGKTLFQMQGYIGTDPATGKRIRVTRRGFKSEEDCQKEYYRLKLQFEAGEFNNKVVKYTFQEVYDLWIQQYQNTVKESTLQNTMTLFRCHILPKFGKMYINRIKITHCQEAVNHWFKVLKNFRIVNSYAGLVFRHAMKLGIISSNPTELVTMPVTLDQVEDEDDIENFFSKAELLTFLEGIDSQKWKTFFRVLAYSGFRKGEALALTWNDINFKKLTISVSKTLTIGLDNKLIVQTPKTKKSKRTVSIDPGTMEMLKIWKRIQAEEMIGLGFNVNKPDQLVFTNLKNKFINPQKVGQMMIKYCQRSGVKYITPHGLRHTHCSILFEAGATLKDVQDRLGHSDIKTTMNIYAHVTEQKKEETALKFAAFLGS